MRNSQVRSPVKTSEDVNSTSYETKTIFDLFFAVRSLSTIITHIILRTYINTRRITEGFIIASQTLFVCFFILEA